MGKGDHSRYLATLLLKVRVKLLLEHVGLSHVLDLDHSPEGVPVAAMVKLSTS